MRGRLPEQRSGLADTARLAGALCVPVASIALFGALNGLVGPPALIGAFAVAVGLAVLALVLAIAALVAIWRSGAEGARSAGLAILYGSPALVVLAAAVAAAIVFPRLDDVSTDPVDPPRFVARSALEPAPDRDAVAGQIIAYPDLAPRLYDRPLGEVHAAALDAVEDRGWILVGEVPPAAMPAAGGGEGALATPPASLETGIEARVPAPLLGFDGYVAVRLRATVDGTRVDVRSAWGGGPHDFGEDARRIRRFLADLDVRLGAT